MNMAQNMTFPATPSLISTSPYQQTIRSERWSEGKLTNQRYCPILVILNGRLDLHYGSPNQQQHNDENIEPREVAHDSLRLHAVAPEPKLILSCASELIRNCLIDDKEAD
jgi:hypothetical protein